MGTTLRVDAVGDLRDDDGNTALSRAANEVDLDTIESLIEKGADVNAGCYNLTYSHYGIFNYEKEYYSSTPLMNVIANYIHYDDTIKVIELMLSKGADVNLFDSMGETAIEFCFRRKEWRNLLDVILKYTKQNDIERKQYDVYDNNDYYDQLLYLYEKEIMLYNEDEFKRLICSSAERNKEDQEAKVRLLKKMLELGIDNFNKKKEEKDKDDIIVCAAILENPDKVKQLLKDGANVNVRFYYHKLKNAVNYNSSTALMCVAEKGNEEIVKLLLSDKNIDVDVKADNGWSALSYAIVSENIKIVKLLGERTVVDNRELLMTVVKMFNYEYGYKSKFDDKSLVNFVKIILNIKGVDVNFKNSEGQTPLMYLVVKNTNNSDERLKTISETAGEIIKREGVNLNAQDNSGKTALMYFIEKNPDNNYNDVIIHILKNKDVNVNLQDTSGKSALFYAVIANNSTITEAILENANVNAQDNSGKTALFYTKDPKMVALLSRKISMNAQDNSGKTALSYAPPKLIESLVEGGADVNEVEDVVKSIIEKLGVVSGSDSYKSLDYLMTILQTVPGLGLSYKNQKGYNVITYLFSTDLKTTTKNTKMINQVLKYCYEYIAQNQFLFNHVYEVEYYITYIKNEMKKKKENTVEFKNIIESLGLWKKHISVIPGSVGAGNASKRFSEMAIIEYPSKKKPKFGGRPRRSYIKKKSQSATGANLRRRRSKRKTTVRYSPIRKCP